MGGRYVRGTRLFPRYKIAGTDIRNTSDGGEGRDIGDVESSRKGGEGIREGNTGGRGSRGRRLRGGDEVLAYVPQGVLCRRSGGGGGGSGRGSRGGGVMGWFGGLLGGGEQKGEGGGRVKAKELGGAKGVGTERAVVWDDGTWLGAAVMEAAAGGEIGKGGEQPPPGEFDQ